MSIADHRREPVTDFSLRNLVDLRRLQQVQDEFSAEHGLAMIAVDPRGVPVTTASHFTPFCQLMRQDPVLRRACFSCDAHGGLQAAIDNRPYIYRCHTGLIDMSAPIVHDGIYLGALLCGQVQVADLELSPVFPELSEWQSDRERLRHFDAIPVMDETDLHRTAEALFQLTTDIANGAGERVESVTPATPVRLFLAQAESWRAPATYDLTALAHSVAAGDAASTMRTIGHYLTRISLSDEALVEVATLSDLEIVLIDGAEQVSAAVAARVRLAIQQQRSRTGRRKQLSRYDAQLYAESLAWPIVDALGAARAGEPRTLTDLLNLIERDLARPPSLGRAAKYLSVSLSHFSRIFKAATNTNYVAYVTDKRIERAKFLLAYTDTPVTRIATDLGFNPPNYFSRTFKKALGSPPSEYRRVFSHLKGHSK